MLISEMFEQDMTIAAAQKANGEIDRAKADRILDPRGYFRRKRKKRKVAEAFNPATIPADKRAELRRLGFDTDELLYHGTNKTFDTFDRKMLRTADHFYTTPDPRTASTYGETILVCLGRQAPQADLLDNTPESAQLLDRLSETFAEEFTLAVETDEDMQAVKARLMRALLAANAETDPDYDEMQAEWDAEDHEDYKAALLQAAKLYVREMLTSADGRMYGTRGTFQGMVMNECFGNGFRSVRWYDPNDGGSPISVTFKDASDIIVVGRMAAGDAEDQFFTYARGEL